MNRSRLVPVPSPEPAFGSFRSTPGWCRLFLTLTSISLAIVALAKAYSLVRGGAFLATTEPVLGLTHRTLLLVATLAEGLAAGIALHPRISPVLRGTALFWIGCSTAAYRLLLWATGAPVPCPCLGSVTSWWPWLARHQDAVLLPLMGLLLLALPLSHFAQTLNKHDR